MRNIVFVAISAIATGDLYDGPAQPARNNRKEKNNMLTQQEAAFLRGVIYNEGFSTTMRGDSPLPQRQVALKKEIVELHKNKRVGTIGLLSDIVKGGRPADARAAGVTALALEVGPVYAVLWGDGDLNLFDKARVPDGKTGREKLTERMDKLLTGAEN